MYLQSNLGIEIKRSQCIHAVVGEIFRSCSYLSLQPLVQPASDHASGVGLDGDDGPQPVSECPAHQVAPTATLEARDPLTGHVIRRAQLPGTNQSLQAREACSHLNGHGRKEERSIFSLF